METITEGVPVILVDHGWIVEVYMRKTHVAESDIRQTARQNEGLERMDQIKYAVLETSGGISIIPLYLAWVSSLAREGAILPSWRWCRA